MAEVALTSVDGRLPEQRAPKVPTELSSATRATLALVLTGFLSQAACESHQASPPVTSYNEKVEQTEHNEDDTDSEALLAEQDRKDEGVDPKGTASEIYEQGGEADDEVIPYTYERGTREPHISPEGTLYPKIREIYAKQKEAMFTTYNLREHFPNYSAYIVNEDPITHEPITFLGKPISGGVNLAMIPFIKIAERKIMDMGLDYAPREEKVIGAEDRNMAVRNKEGNVVLHADIPSFHKYGLAFDIDRSSNSPDHGRGNIPDEVILALVEAGFAAGAHGKPPNSFYLVGDFMHSEMQFTPDSPEGQKIINASPIGIRYWEAVKPMMEALKEH